MLFLHKWGCWVSGYTDSLQCRVQRASSGCWACVLPCWEQYEYKLRSLPSPQFMFQKQLCLWQASEMAIYVQFQLSAHKLSREKHCLYGQCISSQSFLGFNVWNLPLTRIRVEYRLTHKALAIWGIWRRCLLSSSQSEIGLHVAKAKHVKICILF